MVTYFDHHSCQMFIRDKPIRFGFKIWMLCEANGYPYHMSVYNGRKPRSDLEHQPFGARVVNQMLQVVQAHSNILKHEIYFNNFFTNYDLLSVLKSKIYVLLEPSEKTGLQELPNHDVV